MTDTNLTCKWCIVQSKIIAEIHFLVVFINFPLPHIKLCSFYSVSLIKSRNKTKHIIINKWQWVIVVRQIRAKCVAFESYVPSGLLVIGLSQVNDRSHCSHRFAPVQLHWWDAGICVIDDTWQPIFCDRFSLLTLHFVSVLLCVSTSWSQKSVEIDVTRAYIHIIEFRLDLLVICCLLFVKCRPLLSIRQDQIFQFALIIIFPC